MKLKAGIISFLLLVAIPVCAFEVRVKILASLHSTQLSFHAEVGNYLVFSNGILVAEVLEQQTAQVKNNTDGSVELILGGSNIGNFPVLKFISADSINYFEMQSLQPASRKYSYDNGLEVTSWGTELQLVNMVSVDNYVAGVVEAEVGHINHLELFKVQAVISRTYAMRYIGKNGMNGYDVGDDVYDQAYKGRNRYHALARKAAYETSGLVIVDSAMQPIKAVFHSNSGGVTCNSEDYWVGKPEYYLKSVADTFSIGQPSYSWEKKIPLHQWRSYLQSKGIKGNLCFCDVPYRQSMLTCNGSGAITTREIREDWKLRSSYFTISEKGDEIIIRGKGFGHGIGMSQEGAARMAHLGYKFDQIINFYYAGVRVVEMKRE